MKFRILAELGPLRDVKEPDCIKVAMAAKGKRFGNQSLTELGLLGGLGMSQPRAARKRAMAARGTEI